MVRPILIAAGIAFALPQTALAEKNWVKVGENVTVAPYNLPADAVDEMDVVDAAGRKIGEVDEVIGPTKTEATALTIDLTDNAGLDDRDGDIIVPLAGVQLLGDRLQLIGDAKTLKGYKIYADE